MSTPNRLAMDLRDGRKSAIDRVRRALLGTTSIDAAARKLGIAPGTLKNWACAGYEREIPAVSALWEELGLRLDDDTRAARLDKMRKLRAEGLSLAEVGGRLGVSGATVSRELRRG